MKLSKTEVELRLNEVTYSISKFVYAYEHKDQSVAKTAQHYLDYTIKALKDIKEGTKC